MSAYDNPTIIRDDSAMAWAQGIGSFAENFTQSFNIARKEKEAKEKEARLEAEKKAKEDKELVISRQKFYSENTAKNSEDASKTSASLEKAGVKPNIAKGLVDFRFKAQTKIGNYNEEAAYTELPEGKAEEAAKFNENFNNLWSWSTQMVGGGASQMQAIANGDIGKTNASNIEYVGDDDISRLQRAVISTKGSSGMVSADLIYDLDKLEETGMSISMNTKNISKEELENYIRGVNPNIISNKDGLQTFIDKNSDAIQVNKDGTYNIIYDQKVDGEKTGEFYVIIPDAKKEKDLQTAGIYDNRDQLQESFFKGPQYVKAEGNAGISTSEATVKVPKREIDMGAVDKLLTKQANVAIEGLLASELRDMNKLRGFGRIIGAWGAGTEAAKEFVKMGTKEQVDKFSKYIIDGYRADIMRDNNIRFDKKENKYYQLDEMALKEFDSNQGKTSGKDKTGTSKETWEEKEAAIKSVASISGTHRWGSNSVYTDGAGNWYENRNMDAPLNSQEEALAYLRTGKKSSKKSGKK
jgi:hypothetical protein